MQKQYAGALTLLKCELQQLQQECAESVKREVEARELDRDYIEQQQDEIEELVRVKPTFKIQMPRCKRRMRHCESSLGCRCSCSRRFIRSERRSICICSCKRRMKHVTLKKRRRFTGNTLSVSRTEFRSWCS